MLFFIVPDLKECKDDTCSNGGTCMDDENGVFENGVYCTCPPGYTGPICDIGIHVNQKTHV